MNLVSACDVRRTIEALPLSPAVFSNGISLLMLRKLSNTAVEAITALFNASIKTGTLSALRKHAHVTPMLKNKGDIYDAAINKPIAILPIISKVVEQLIKEQLLTFLDNNDIIDNAQHGFGRKRSCQTALLSLDPKQLSRITSVDFARAFDTLNLDVLIHRIASFSDASAVK